MNVFLTNTFKRLIKRLHENQIIELEKAIQQIQEKPLLGDLKSGDLAGVRVFKFHIDHQLMLLAYILDQAQTSLTLLSCAAHENFYDNLKKSIKS
ncbi:MAG: addiction module toxin RelE [Gammaproteobacteria bacterium CG11_big_fil_rev_8_21_14_0_20_46_22]|nr:MAG: addiction module toxin RelE [Gammaproteobacteria bacterium CG11_big_fil_rev_8_21_14_0_20_46_22]